MTPEDLKFLEELYVKSLLISDGIDFWINIHKKQIDNEQIPSNPPQEYIDQTKTNMESVLKMLEDRLGFCDDITFWIEGMIDVIKEKIKNLDGKNISYEDSDIKTIEQAMREHRELYPEDNNPDI